MSLIFSDANSWHQASPTVNAPVGVDMHTALADQPVKESRLNASGRVYLGVCSAFQVQRHSLFSPEEPIKVCLG
jgi:hypothetical protein